MNILVIGSGGREHALGWKIKQSPHCDNLFFTPGNGGTSDIGSNLPSKNKEEILAICQDKEIDLVMVGPDDYLADGIVDYLTEHNIKSFGPTKTASKFEWSKAYAKEFMKEHGIPTAAYETFSNIADAKRYIQSTTYPAVIKADGLALGKGVIIVHDQNEALLALNELMHDKKFGSSGEVVVIEEFMQGIEISTHAFCDGEIAIMFPTAQDRKRALDGDVGLNTGGMGTIAPVPGLGQEVTDKVYEQIVKPTLAAMRDEGTPFKGILFPGIMLTKDGPKVIEFNARFGDPETQSYMHLLETDIVEVMLACIDGTLSQIDISWSTDSACCVIMASGGYPESYEKEKVISGLDQTPNEIKVFHAGTKTDGEALITSGGRVLGVTTKTDNLEKSLANVYEAVETIDFENKFTRSDIGSQRYFNK